MSQSANARIAAEVAGTMKATGTDCPADPLNPRPVDRGGVVGEPYFVPRPILPLRSTPLGAV